MQPLGQPGVFDHGEGFLRQFAEHLVTPVTGHLLHVTVPDLVTQPAVVDDDPFPRAGDDLLHALLAFPQALLHFEAAELGQPLEGEEFGEVGDEGKVLVQLVLADDRHPFHGEQVGGFLEAVTLRLEFEASAVGWFQEELPGEDVGEVLPLYDERSGGVGEPHGAGDLDVALVVLQSAGDFLVAFDAEFFGGGVDAVELGADVLPTGAGQDLPFQVDDGGRYPGHLVEAIEDRLQFRNVEEF